MGALPLVLDGALGTPRYDYRHPSFAPRIKLEDDVSPKSVIADIRFVSPASSSSSSTDRRPVAEATPSKLQQPRHDRGYSISDGECSDQDTLIESSRELNKVCTISGSLESLPETHSLTLKATRASNIWKGEGSSNGRLPRITNAVLPTMEDKYQIQHSKTPYQMVASSDCAPTQDAASVASSLNNQTTSGSSSWVNSHSGVSVQDMPALNRCDEEINMGTSMFRSPVDFPGTPVRFFPGWQTQFGSPAGSHISFGSPSVEKGSIGSYSPTSLAEHLSRGISCQHRFLSGPLHGGISPRPPPSKWDDAEKWIASPGHHVAASPQPHLHRPVQALPSGRRHSISGHCHRPNFGASSPEFAAASVEGKPLSPMFENTNGRSETLIYSASQKKRSKTLSFGDLSKRVFDISCSNACETTSIPPRFGDHAAEMEDSSKHVSQLGSRHEIQSDEVKELDTRQESPTLAPSSQSRECEISESLQDDKSKTAGTAKCFDNSMDMEILKHALAESMKGIGSYQLQSSCPADLPPPSIHSWKFGRRTTSVQGQKISACATPAFIASPIRHNTPARSGRRPGSFGSLAGIGVLDLQNCHLVKLEVCRIGGDDRNMAWSTQEEEDMECSISLRDNDSGLVERDFKDVMSAAWGEAEQTKHKERPNNEEAKIKAWEEHQTSKAEAEMQKIEIKIEKMRLRALEKMTNRIAVARKKAKEMRASTHTKKSADSAKTVQQVEQIRVFGRASPIPRSLFRYCFKA